MTFPVVGSNIPGAYQISNSLRFNDDDNAYLNRTPSSAGNRKTYTVSFWVKRGNLGLSYAYIFDCDNGASQTENPISFDNDTIRFSAYNGSSNDFNLVTTQVFRDTSAWYHITQVVDTTQATASNRVKFYINGSQITSFSTATYPSLNYNMAINSASIHAIGKWQDSGTRRFDGYLAEFHFIDGTAKSPTDFGEFDEDSGVWKPKQYAGTYGTNGFYLKFNNTGNMGEDSSGNDNTFTPTNLSGTTDVTTDTPTNNFATVNALDNIYNPATLSEGNLRIDFDSGTSIVYNTATMAVSSGKWYWEVNAVTIPGYAYIGIAERPCQGAGNTDALTASQYNYGYAASDGNIKSNNSAGSSYGDTYTSGDIIGVALDLDNNKLYVSKNGTWQNSANPSAGTGGFSIEPVANVQDSVYYPAFGDNRNGYATRMDINFGNPPYTISSGNSDANGYGNMEYSVPTGFSTLCTQNLATELSPTIDDGSAYFHTQLYTGDGTTGRSITNDANAGNFQPDWLWIKERSSTSSHRLTDSSRGVNKVLISSGTNAELTRDEIGSYDTDGFTIDGTTDGVGAVNESSQTYVAWQWLANGGTTSSNTDGSITSTVQANTTAGFSIVTYTGNGTAGATIGHGLGQAPDMTIIKRRSASETWIVWHTAFNSAQSNIRLESTGAVDTASPAMFNNTFPTSSLITLGNGNFVNTNTETYVCYAFKSIEGYSKFGSYTGNGGGATGLDGTFVYTGFRPALTIFKRTDSATNWRLYDSKRDTYNVMTADLRPNLSQAEGGQDFIDFLSNGFKLKTNGGDGNASGGTYIYMAFAENPFVTSGATPVTAR